MINPNTNTGEVIIPKTVAPNSVWGWDIALFLAIFTILFILFGLSWSDLFWSTALTLLGIAGTVYFGLIVEEVVDFHAVLLFNPLNKTRRTVFPGLHPKLFWEKLEEGSKTSLLRVITSAEPENFPTNDPAENMKVSLTVHMRVNVSGVTPEEAADNFIRFHSIKEDTLTALVRKEIVKLFSAFYSKREMEKLLNPNRIQESISKTSVYKKKKEELETRWGISIGIILGTSNPDEETKNMKRTPARAESLRTSIKKLTEDKMDKQGVLVDKGLNLEQARRAALLLDETAEYKEEQIILTIDAHGLEKLHDVNLVPPGVFGGGKKGGKQ